MKRLIRVSLDILITSCVPVAGWFLLGMLMDKDLINIFTLTYPLQFILNLINAIFGTGANISGYKEDNENAIDTGIILGTIVGGLIFGIVICHIDQYIGFMQMDVEKYRVFGIYSVVQILLQTILHLILSKLYYQEKNKEANKITITFNIVNFTSLIGAAIVTRNPIHTTIFSIIIMLIYIGYIMIKNLGTFKFSINLWKCIKYESFDITTSIMFFIIYLFGISNIFHYGKEYALAVSFSTLITDIQWDMTSAIKTVAKIDITKKQFFYSEHLKNAYKLIGILVLSIITRGILLLGSYNPEISIVAIIIGAQIIGFLCYPFYIIKSCYLQLEYSATKTTVNKQIANSLRTIGSFSPTPFRTIIGQMVSMIYQMIYSQILWRNVEKDIVNQIKEKE